MFGIECRACAPGEVTNVDHTQCTTLGNDNPLNFAVMTTILNSSANLRAQALLQCDIDPAVLVDGSYVQMQFRQQIAEDVRW